MPETATSVFKIVIKGSLQAVWHEITKTDELQGCMFNMWLDTNGLKPGGQIRMRTASRKNTGVVGEVLEFNPPYRYVHTFRFTGFDDPACKVIHELKEVEGGVEYSMTLADVAAGTKTEKQMTQGTWLILNSLKGIVETGRPPFKIRLIYRLMGWLEWMTPKRQRSENWPL